MLFFTIILTKMTFLEVQIVQFFIKINRMRLHNLTQFLSQINRMRLLVILLKTRIDLDLRSVKDQQASCHRTRLLLHHLTS